MAASKTLASPGPSTTTNFKDKLTSVITVTTRGAATKDLKTVTLHVSMLPSKAPRLAELAKTSSSDLKLLDLDSDAFGIFAAWLYGNTVTFDAGDGSEPYADPGDILTSVLDCFVLGTKIQATEFRNAVLTRACAISAEHGLVFRNEVVNLMYTKTRQGSMVRKWIVDEWVWQFDCENVGELDWESNKELEKEFVFDVLRAQARRLGKKAFRRVS